jgi:5-methylcytosine-specific restriction enzyme B
VEPGASRDELRGRLRATYPDRPDGAIHAWVGNLDRFVNRIGVGDLLVTPDGSDIHIGQVTTGPFHVPDHEEAHRRGVRWLTGSEPVWRGDLSERAHAMLTTMLTVADLTEVSDELAAHAGLPTG